MKYIAGIDGGGTKTIVICSDLDRNIVKEQRFGPFNVNSIGKEGFAALLEEICAFCRRRDSAPRCASVRRAAAIPICRSW